MTSQNLINELNLAIEIDYKDIAKVKALNVAKLMIMGNYSLEDISKYTDLSIEELNSLKISMLSRILMVN